MHACLGLSWLGQCTYDPAAPASIYFSPGAAIGALAFTLAVHQLLRPIYRFRLSARYLRVRHLYIVVFAAAGATLIAALVPNFPVLHGGPWGYAIVWEVLATTLFVVAYGAVVLATVHPIRVRPRRIVQFARGVATLLSAANETDHTDLVDDLTGSLPTIIKAASFGEHQQTTAFFDFIHRKEIERASYAFTLLRVIADPLFCATLVKRAPWRVALMLKEISAKRLHSRAAEQFVRELAHQAIIRDDSMMTREIGYHGFGTAPLLSDSLFSDPFILIVYDPFHTFFAAGSDATVGPLLGRFNSAAERCYTTLIEEGHVYEAQAAFSIKEFYSSIFMKAYTFQKGTEYDHRATIEMILAVRLATRMANKLLASVGETSYHALFVSNSSVYRHDVLETLVEIVYEALTSIGNSFRGVDDPFWMLAIGVMHDVFHSVGDQPDGMTPFQQRLALKLIRKLNENMRGFYPAVSRVLLVTVGPYHHRAGQPNRTAFNILKDAVYVALRRLPQLARTKPDKIEDYLAPNVAYRPETSQLVHTYRGGAQNITDLLALNVPAFSIISSRLRRGLTDNERR